ncbi:MAG: 4-phosphoerythronate dehydrogenase PdxB [Melioribacteraceae bacterium]|nr:4-phosphoerythronate dehydrogenase PdxB [Melioribacteraceae bacterium]
MSAKIKIVADDKIPFLKGVLDSFAKIDYLNYLQIKNEILKDVDALLVRTRTKCNKELLDNTSVKFIATATIGFDHIDTKYCEEKNIKWLNAPGCNSSSVMQYFASALLNIAKKKNISLKEKTLGIIGVGNVGKKVEKFARTIGMNVLLNDPPRERVEGSKNFVSLDYLIANSDIITFHVPLNRSGIDKTYHLADKFFFEKFNTEKILINTSRGEVIKSEDLLNAIEHKKIIASILDVWENEPEIDLKLLEKVDIATPHIAGYSADGKANGTAICVNELNKFFNLGLNENWYPEKIPSPENPQSINVDCKDKTNQVIIFEIVNHTYKILEDDERLRKSVKTFEQQRANYPVRREFNFYKVNLINSNDEIKNIVSNLGFNLE